jgi:hypothetical protein
VLNGPTTTSQEALWDLTREEEMALIEAAMTDNTSPSSHEQNPGPSGTNANTSSATMETTTTSPSQPATTTELEQLLPSAKPCQYKVLPLNSPLQLSKVFEKYGDFSFTYFAEGELMGKVVIFYNS